MQSSQTISNARIIVGRFVCGRRKRQFRMQRRCFQSVQGMVIVNFIGYIWTEYYLINYWWVELKWLWWSLSPGFWCWSIAFEMSFRCWMSWRISSGMKNADDNWVRGCILIMFDDGPGYTWPGRVHFYFDSDIREKTKKYLDAVRIRVIGCRCVTTWHWNRLRCRWRSTVWTNDWLRWGKSKWCRRHFPIEYI